MTWTDTVPLRDRIAVPLVLLALVPYFVALAGAWWFLRHGDDGVEVIEVGSWPVAMMLSSFLWVALGSAFSTARILLGRPSVFWHHALPFRRIGWHLVAAGLASLVALGLLTGWLPVVAELAGLALPVACTVAFARAVSPRVPRDVAPASFALPRRMTVALCGYVVLAILAVVVLEISRTVGERETIAGYAAVALLGMPWSAGAFPLAFLTSITAREMAPAVFDGAAILALAINVVLVFRIVLSKAFRARALSRFFLLGPAKPSIDEAAEDALTGREQ